MELADTADYSHLLPPAIFTRTLCVNTLANKTPKNRYGTDVYLHLNRLSSSSEPLQ